MHHLPHAFPISFPWELGAKLLPGSFSLPGPYHWQGHRLAIREAIKGLADKAVLLVCTAAKLEGWMGSVRGEGLSGSPACTSPLYSPTATVLYPMAPLALGHFRVHPGLEVFGVVEAGRVWAARLPAV